MIWSEKQLEKVTWQEAMDFAEQLNQEKHLGYDDWRLPERWGLARAYDERVLGFFKESYWSSTTDAYNTGYAWRVNFSYGYVNFYSTKTYYYYARCVRG